MYLRFHKENGLQDREPELRCFFTLLSSEGAVDASQKSREHLTIGVVQVWVADPEAHSISVHRPPTDVKEFGEADRLLGGELLPGFETAVAGLFKAPGSASRSPA